MRDPSATGQSGIAGDEHPRRRSPAFDTSRKSMACISSSKNSGGRPLLYVQVTPLFLAATIAIATAVAFIVGLTVSHDLSMMRQPPTSIGIEDAVVIHAPGSIELPVPVMIEGKKAPLSTYSSKTLLGKTSTVRLDTTGSSSIVVENKTTGADLHLPSGQHLLVDLKGVDSEFLNSEQQLAEAMLDLVTESRLTLLSYHCHSLVPTGVACIGVLLESHVSKSGPLSEQYHGNNTHQTSHHDALFRRHNTGGIPYMAYSRSHFSGSLYMRFGILDCNPSRHRAVVCHPCA